MPRLANETVSFAYCRHEGLLTVAAFGMNPAPLDQSAIAVAVARWDAWRHSPERSRELLLTAGTELARALIPRPFRQSLQAITAEARRRAAPIRLFIEGEGEFLASIPWEILCLEARSPNDPIDGMLSLEADISLVRRSGQGEVADFEESGEARILVVSANPGSWRYPTLAWLAAETRAIEAACGRAEGSPMIVQTLFDASPEELRQAIVAFRPHAFHFSGHAESGPQGTSLVLQGPQREAVHLIHVATVGKWLTSVGCRLAVLSACEMDVRQGSAALALRQAGLAAVVAMQEVVRDASQPGFSRALYGALLDGMEIDRAVVEARLSIAGPGCSESLPTLWCDAPFALVGALAFEARSPIPGNLPPSPNGPFVGRAAELTAVAQALDTSRAVTLVGTGGIGKSRLALAAARRVRAAYPDGVWLVECATLESEEDVWMALARLLSSAPSGFSADAAVATLRDRRPLIVLDCFEGLVVQGRSPLIETLLRETGATLLLTSRVALDHQDVAQIDVHPLGFGSVRASSESLFLELVGLDRATLTPSTTGTVSEICGLLDGVPLALAVAAGRAQLIGVVELRNMLAQSPIQALGGVTSIVGLAVQRSLSLIPADDQDLLWRLSVFSGGFDWASASHVYPENRFAMLDGIQRLVAGSLLRRVDGPEAPRFQIMDSVRDYLTATLQDQSLSAERLEACGRQVEFFVGLAQRAFQSFLEGRWAEGSRLVLNDLANFRAALAFARTHSLNPALAALAKNLCRFLLESGQWHDFDHFAAEGYRAAELIEDRKLYTDLLGLEGALAGRRGDAALCEKIWARRAALCRETGDGRGFVDATLDLAYDARTAGKYDQALVLIEDAKRELETLDRPDLQATAAIILATIELARGKPDAARAATLEAENLGALAKEKDSMLYVRTEIGHLWSKLDDLPRAEAAYAEALAEAMSGERRSHAAMAALLLSSILETRGKIEVALLCAIASETIFKDLGSRRLGEAQRRTATLTESYPNHPAQGRRSQMTATAPFELLGEALKRLNSYEDRAYL